MARSKVKGATVAPNLEAKLDGSSLIFIIPDVSKSVAFSGDDTPGMAGNSRRVCWAARGRFPLPVDIGKSQYNVRVTVTEKGGEASAPQTQGELV